MRKNGSIIDMYRLENLLEDFSNEGAYKIIEVKFLRRKRRMESDRMEDEKENFLSLIKK